MFCILLRKCSFRDLYVQTEYKSWGREREQKSDEFLSNNRAVSSRTQWANISRDTSNIVEEPFTTTHSEQDSDGQKNQTKKKKPRKNVCPISGEMFGFVFFLLFLNGITNQYLGFLEAISQSDRSVGFFEILKSSSLRNTVVRNAAQCFNAVHCLKRFPNFS